LSGAALRSEHERISKPCTRHMIELLGVLASLACFAVALLVVYGLDRI
jgi:hypothetical protein